MMIGVPIGTPVIEIFDKLGIKVPEGDIVVDGGQQWENQLITKLRLSLKPQNLY